MSFHKFNPFTGRLTPSSQLEAVYPLSPNPLQKVEPPKMMFDSRETKIATASRSKQQSYSTLSPKMIKIQQQYQADLSKPSYLLRGAPDRLLFGLSVGLLVLSTAANAYYLVQLQKKFR